MTKSIPLPYFSGDADVLLSVSKESNGKAQQHACRELKEPNAERGTKLFYSPAKRERGLDTEGTKRPDLQ